MARHATAHQARTLPVPVESPARSLPVRHIGLPALRDALREGLADFAEKPSHILFLGIIYPLVGGLLAALVFGRDILPLLFPLVAGFALIGPLAAMGLYELSRRRERGLDTSWRYAFDVLKSPSIGSIAVLGVLLMAVFVGWLAVAMWIYDTVFGGQMPQSITGFASEVLFTPRGWTLIGVGIAAGIPFAVASLMIGVVSFPLLLDRDVGAVVALRTSVRAVLENPVTMAAWGLAVAALLVLGSIPLFVGLAVVMPVLGHATWRLYRKLVF